jgi:hypothetical protein
VVEKGEKWVELWGWVVESRDVGEFNVRVREFLEFFGLKGEVASVVFWSLFYSWKERVGL